MQGKRNEPLLSTMLDAVFHPESMRLGTNLKAGKLHAATCFKCLENDLKTDTGRSQFLRGIDGRSAADTMPSDSAP